MSRFVLRQIARNQSTKDILVDRTVTIQAESGATYQILDARSMKPATGVVLKRKGDALVVEADGEVAVEVERFYGSQAGAVFEASGGGGQVQVVTEATAVPELSPGAAQGGGAAAAANGAGGELLVGALALGGLGLLSSSGGSAAAPVDNTVVAKVVAGPVVKGNDLIAMIYAADDKTLLGQGAINEDGTVTIKVGSYTGVVIVKVKNDQNPANDGADYMDEATGVSKDLGDAVLSSMGEIVTLNGVITLNVNILTALAYHEAAEAAKGAPLTAPLVRDTNAAVAKAFGLESLTEGDIKTIVDQGGKASSSNKYGELLAALSGADKNNGGSVKATLDALINAVSVTGTTATLTPAVTTLLSEGAKVVDPANSKGLLSTVQSALQSSSNTTPSTPPSTPVTTDTTPPVASVTTTTISSTGNATVQSNEPGTAYLVRDTVAVTNLASITSAADNVWNSVALSAANTATSLRATGLVDGIYRVYAVDAAGNLSTVSSNSITIDATPPVTSVATANITTAGSAEVQSTEPGTAYLVRNNVQVPNSNLYWITSAPDKWWNSVPLPLANTVTSLPATGLEVGTYGVYAADAAGNLSAASSGSITIVIPDTTPPQASVQAATISSTGSTVVYSSEFGTAYLVQDTVGVTSLESITSAADSVWNSGAISRNEYGQFVANIIAPGLRLGTYKAYTVDTAGNLSTPSVSSIIINSQIELSAIAAGSGGFVINGESPNAGNDSSLASAGDVNGDGLTDLIVGARWAIPTGKPIGGKSYVLFGKTGGAAVELSDVEAGAGGFVINGGSYYGSGKAVAFAGDLNGDGLSDLIVGASPPDNGNAGKSYVVFGKTGGAAVELSAVGAGNGGFAISGQSMNDNSGVSLASAGDVNGDGFADLIVGAPYADPAGQSDAGKSYVVFGKTGGGEIALSAVVTGNGGFVINGQSINDRSGVSVASAGDVNGDGLADLIVGAFYADPTGRSNAGKSYVVFGKTGGAAVELSAVEAGGGGFVISGQSADDQSGLSVASAGDVNGDGLADLIVGASQADPTGGSNAGKSYVVFGKTGVAAVELSAVAAGGGFGFVINGANAVDDSGVSVASAGDMNGDGLADLIVGARLASPAQGLNTSITSAGKTYVVFGKASDAAVELSDVANNRGGFVINGESRADNSGWVVASAGDVNGDGLADLMVGASQADPTGKSNAGKSYVIFGSTSGAFSETAVDELGTTGNDALSDGGAAKTLVGGAGDDALSAAAASVLYGGSGNDVFQIGADMITALQSPMGSGGNVNQLARIDGGTGIDTIALSGGGLALDLTQIANQSASNTNGSSRINSIEAIDLTGTGNNTLKLKVNDLFDMTGFNNFAATGRRQLLVKGDTGDAVDLADGSGTTGWAQAGTQQTIDSVAYNVWSHNTSLVTLYVAPSIGVI
jgi:hypothetical protein